MVLKAVDFFIYKTGSDLVCLLTTHLRLKICEVGMAFFYYKHCFLLNLLFGVKLTRVRFSKLFGNFKSSCFFKFEYFHKYEVHTFVGRCLKD